MINNMVNGFSPLAPPPTHNALKNKKSISFLMNYYNLPNMYYIVHSSIVPMEDILYGSHGL